MRLQVEHRPNSWNLRNCPRPPRVKKLNATIAILVRYDGQKRRRKRGSVMGWATQYIARLEAGETVQFRPRGNSMAGKIESGQLCTVEPVDPGTLEVGDIVLCKASGAQYLHLVKAIQGERFQIGNNRGRINGWISAGSIYGRCVKIE